MEASAQLHASITLFLMMGFCVADRVAVSVVWTWWRQNFLTLSDIEPDCPASSQSLPFFTELSHYIYYHCYDDDDDDDANDDDDNNTQIKLFLCTS